MGEFFCPVSEAAKARSASGRRQRGTQSVPSPGSRKLENTAGTLVYMRPSLHENEGEDAGASSPSHMRNYLATIDRLPAARSAAGRWREKMMRRTVSVAQKNQTNYNKL